MDAQVAASNGTICALLTEEKRVGLTSRVRVHVKKASGELRLKCIESRTDRDVLLLLLFLLFYCGARERQILHMYTIKFI